ncbi:hypothetical protein CWC48_29980 [Pseudomonas sp. S10E 269]|nr:hypothetical protein CWC49_29875 [Pseudomonas sp. S09F 262]PJK37560.1 hypothetical protein CWC48_29980 [Pseudomonas sp. S10E 269]
MHTQTLKTPEQYAKIAQDYADTDLEISRRHFEKSLQFLTDGEPHTRRRGIKHPIMIGVYLNDDFIYMIDKFTEWAKASGRLNPYAKRQDFIRKGIIELMLKELDESTIA